MEFHATPEMILSAGFHDNADVNVDQDADSPLTIDLVTGDVFMTYLATYRDFVRGRRVEMLLPGDRYVIIDIPKDTFMTYPMKGISIDGNPPGNLYVFVKLVLHRDDVIDSLAFSTVSTLNPMFVLSS